MVCQAVPVSCKSRGAVDCALLLYTYSEYIAVYNTVEGRSFWGILAMSCQDTGMAQGGPAYSPVFFFSRDAFPLVLLSS